MVLIVLVVGVLGFNLYLLTSGTRLHLDQRKMQQQEIKMAGQYEILTDYLGVIQEKTEKLDTRLANLENTLVAWRKDADIGMQDIDKASKKGLETVQVQIKGLAVDLEDMRTKLSKTASTVFGMTRKNANESAGTLENGRDHDKLARAQQKIETRLDTFEKALGVLQKTVRKIEKQAGPGLVGP